MAGQTELSNRLKKCEKTYNFSHRKRKQSVVYMNRDGEYLWEEGVEYHPGVLAIPLQMTIEEWEQNNIDGTKN